MLHGLQLFLSANMPAAALAVGLIGAIGAAAFRYGRHHEARTRERGTQL